MDHAPLHNFFKQQDLNKHQTYWLQEFIDTPTLKCYQPGNRATLLNILSYSPILYYAISKSADSQPSGINQ